METTRRDAERPSPRRDARPPAAATSVNVSWLMTEKVVTVRPDTSLESAVELMLAQGLSRVPVVDETGALVGMVSKTDIVADAHVRGDTEETERPRVPVGKGIAYEPSGVHLHEVTPVSEVMSRSPVTVSPSDPISRAAELMAVYQVHGLPVVSDAGKLVGFISSQDIVAWVAGLR